MPLLCQVGVSQNTHHPSRKATFEIHVSNVPGISRLRYEFVLRVYVSGPLQFAAV